MAAGFASVLPERESGDTVGVVIVAGLWLVGVAGGIVGSWWTSGNARNMMILTGVSLGTSAARTIGTMVPRSTGYGSLVVALTSVATAFGMVWLFAAIGRQNPDFARAPVTWRATGDPDVPLVATVAGQQWHLRANRRPGEARYTLIVDDEAVLELDRWPDEWGTDYAK
jgi:hypothetical protein